MSEFAYHFSLIDPSPVSKISSVDASFWGFLERERERVAAAV